MINSRETGQRVQTQDEGLSAEDASPGKTKCRKRSKLGKKDKGQNLDTLNELWQSTQTKLSKKKQL